MIQHKACPRCNGSIAHDKDIYGPRVYCIQCGYEKYEASETMSDAAAQIVVEVQRAMKAYGTRRNPDSMAGRVRAELAHIRIGETRTVEHPPQKPCGHWLGRRRCQLVGAIDEWRRRHKVKATVTHVNGDVRVTRVRAREAVSA